MVCLRGVIVYYVGDFVGDFVCEFDFFGEFLYVGVVSEFVGFL